MYSIQCEVYSVQGAGCREQCLDGRVGQHISTSQDIACIDKVSTD